MINPTNGRQVWFRPNGCFLHNFVHYDQPLAATVVHVWGDRLVNLQVLDSNGVAHAITSVTLLQDDDAAPLHGQVYAEWMPYQKTQAAAQAPAVVEVDPAVEGGDQTVVAEPEVDAT